MAGRADGRWPRRKQGLHLYPQEFPQPFHARSQPSHVARVAPPHEPLSFGPERAAGREPEPGLAHQLLAQRQAVLRPGMRKNAYMAPSGTRTSTPGSAESAVTR